MALPKDPRQLMINLMYLVLTAMLALNITKEVLTAFQTINTSIEGSITSIDGKNATFYKQIGKLYDSPETKVKATEAKEKSAKIMDETQKLMAYLDGLKKTVIERSGGFEPSSGASDSVMKGLDNIDVPTKFFVEEKEGANLMSKMNGFKSFLVSQVKDTFKNSIDRSIPISVQNFKPNDENPTGDWSYGTFHNIPVVATVAMISKFQNDVKNSESIVLENLLSQIGAEDYKFDALSAIATPTTSYALEGQEIEATVILAAYSKSVNPSMPGAVVKDGVGTMKFKASGVGQQTKSGTVSITRNGKIESYPYKFNYMVGTAGASLQLDKMNVMYIGVPNPVSLSASGYNIEDVSLSLPGATLTSTGKGHYSAMVEKEGKIEWSILGKSRTGGGTAAIGKGEIRVKRIPDPTARIAGKTGGLIPTGVAKAQLGIVASVDAFDFETTFKVVSFRFTYIPKIGDAVLVDVTGNRFNDECQRLMARSKPGDRWLFDNIKAVGPDKVVRTINTIILTLN